MYLMSLKSSEVNMLNFLFWQEPTEPILIRVKQEGFTRFLIGVHYTLQWVPEVSAGGSRNNLTLFASNPQFLLVLSHTQQVSSFRFSADEFFHILSRWFLTHIVQVISWHTWQVSSFTYSIWVLQILSRWVLRHTFQVSYWTYLAGEQFHILSRWFPSNSQQMSS
jgi:hypothetical protein